MATPAQIAANRANSRSSSGPKTLAGKAASAQNARTHGLLSTAPVVPNLERAEDWEAHRAATIEDLAPVGYVETLWAERASHLLWRLGRVARHEHEQAVIRQDTMESDFVRGQRDAVFFDVLTGPPDYLTPGEAEADVDLADESLRDLDALQNAAAGEAVDANTANNVLVKAGELAGKRGEDWTVEIPGFPPESDLDWDEWPGWTATLVRGGVAAIAQDEEKEAASLWTTTVEALRFELQARRDKAQAELDGMTRTLARQRASQLLAPPEELEMLARHETGIERALWRTIHELERRQERRRGGYVPAAVAVDVALDPGA